MRSEVPDLPRTWRLGPWELDIPSRELSRNGDRIRLQDQPFEILRALIERQGELVTRDELCARLWPDGTFVDFEHSLNAAVKRLRSALGDDALQPRFIETIPRRGYRLRRQPSEEGAADASLRGRLAVLPFTELSEPAGQGTFGEGLTEETVAQLGTICRGRIAVVSRRSTLGFRDTADGAGRIGQALRVGFLLEGSVRRGDGRLRVTARLVETAEETLLWSQTWERPAGHTLEAQTDIATRIAHAVAGELASVGAGDDPSPESQAYRVFLKGQYYWKKPGDSGLDQALEYYAEGVRLAPTFAAAHAALGRGLVNRAEYYRERSRGALERAREAAQRALDYDARQAEAHLTLADASRMLDFDWDASRAGYARAIALNPASEGVHRAHAMFLSALALHREARDAAERALVQDPYCLQIGLTCAWVRYAAGDHASAIEQCLYTIELDPDYLPIRRVLGAAYLLAGRDADARGAFAAALHDHPDDPVLLAWAAHAAATMGRRHEAEVLLARLDVLEDGGYVPPFHRAIAMIGMERLDAAFALLEVAYEDRDPMFASVATDPRFEPLRIDPRYRRAIAQANLSAS